jgi:hypothetical protein
MVHAFPDLYTIDVAFLSRSAIDLHRELHHAWNLLEQHTISGAYEFGIRRL